MKKDFKIFIHRNENSLHLKLQGDFDGEAARELLKILKDRSAPISRVFVHTGSVCEVYPLGSALFREEWEGGSPDLFDSIVFTGEHAELLAPKGCVVT